MGVSAGNAQLMIIGVRRFGRSSATSRSSISCASWLAIGWMFSPYYRWALAAVTCGVAILVGAPMLASDDCRPRD